MSATSHHLCTGRGLPICGHCYRLAAVDRQTRRHPWVEPRVDGDPPACADHLDTLLDDLPL